MAYHEAQVPEFWLIDARLAEMRFTIYRWEPSGYVAAISPEGDPSSTVFGCKVSLLCTRNAAGRFVYDVVTTPQLTRCPSLDLPGTTMPFRVADII